MCPCRVGGRSRAAVAAWVGALHDAADRRMMRGVKLTLDLHDIYNRSPEIERALQGVIDEALAKRVKTVEIIPGKGSGQLKKHVLRFLERGDVKPLYHRVEKDSKNFGRVFVHFRFK
jgi:DNA-nicking Smr family endonuclease